jgi:hypothetical protein
MKSFFNIVLTSFCNFLSLSTACAYILMKFLLKLGFYFCCSTANHSYLPCSLRRTRRTSHLAIPRTTSHVTRSTMWCDGTPVVPLTHQRASSSTSGHIPAFFPVLRIRDVIPGSKFFLSWILMFSIPDPPQRI